MTIEEGTIVRINMFSFGVPKEFFNSLGIVLKPYKQNPWYEIRISHEQINKHFKILVREQDLEIIKVL